MKAPLFEYPTYQYQIKDWEFKKKGLLKRLKEEKFIRTSLQAPLRLIDRQIKRHIYITSKISLNQNYLSSVRNHKSLVV